MPRDISIISRSSSGVIFGREVSSGGETPKPLARLAMDPSSVVESSLALGWVHREGLTGLGEGEHTG